VVCFWSPAHAAILFIGSQVAVLTKPRLPQTLTFPPPDVDLPQPGAAPAAAPPPQARKPALAAPPAEAQPAVAPAEAAKPRKRKPRKAAAAAVAASEAAPRELAAAAAAPAPTATAVTVSVTVPDCVLQFGEHLRLVGSCAELGGWDPSAAPALIWHSGHVWRCQLALPAGAALAFKLVIVRGDGATFYWEPDADRALNIPRLPHGGSRGDPALRVSCRFADTRHTHVECPQLERQARAAAARLAQLQSERKQLSARVVAAWQAVQER
jgi:hypothetical protein